MPAREGLPPDIREDWYKSAFQDLYPIVYAHRTVESAAPESEFAAKAVGLQACDRVLDLCCGNGRHMVHLLAHTPYVLGLDFSLPLLRLACECQECRGRLVQGDMRALPFVSRFDVITNFFTSFGYFASADEDRTVLENVAQALRPRGRFFMDYLNPPHVRANLAPRSCRLEAAYEIIEYRWIDEQLRRINKSTVVKTAGRVVLHTGESVRLYERDELEGMLAEAQLEVDQVFGDYTGAALSQAQPRMIIVAHRK